MKSEKPSQNQEVWLRFFEAYKELLQPHSPLDLLLKVDKEKSKITGIIQMFCPEGGRILDVGCGHGLHDIILAAMGFRVTCVDINKDLIGSARRNAKQFGVEIDFVQASVFDLMSIFGSNAFDLAFSQGLMEHFEDDEIRRAAVSQASVAQDVLIDVPSYHARHFPLLIGDERLMPITQWKRILKTAGLNVVYAYGWADGKLWHKMKRLLPPYVSSRLDVYFCENLGIVCRTARQPK